MLLIPTDLSYYSNCSELCAHALTTTRSLPAEQISSLIRERRNARHSRRSAGQPASPAPAPRVLQVNVRDIVAVKLRPVQRSPGGTPMRLHPPSDSPAVNDHAGIVAFALRKRFAKTRPFLGDSVSTDDRSDDGWSDDENVPPTPVTVSLCLSQCVRTFITQNPRIRTSSSFSGEQKKEVEFLVKSMHCFGRLRLIFLVIARQVSLLFVGISQWLVVSEKKGSGSGGWDQKNSLGWSAVSLQHLSIQQNACASVSVFTFCKKRGENVR